MQLPKGFLFDFDGVVVNSFESHGAAWSSAFKELFNQDIAPFPKSHAGKAPMIIAGYFCGLIGEEKRTEELYLLKDKHLDIHFKVPKLLPGVRELQRYLAKSRSLTELLVTLPNSF